MLVITFLLTKHEGYASFIVSLQLCLERFSILTFEARQLTGLTFDDKVCQFSIGQLLSQDGTEDMEVTAFVPTVSDFIKEADMSLMT
jgi:hypothetical protein